MGDARLGNVACLGPFFFEHSCLGPCCLKKQLAAISADLL
jgi:hypothetical protein